MPNGNLVSSKAANCVSRPSAFSKQCVYVKKKRSEHSQLERQIWKESVEWTVDAAQIAIEIVGGVSTSEQKKDFDKLN